jgi:hypothetical protein
MAVDIPVVVTKAGMLPTPVGTIRDTLLADVASVTPGYTANLPGSLIEDISSTDVAAIALCDTARVDLVNSLTPRGTNAWLANQLGQVYGVKKDAATLTSVGVVFTGPPGQVITAGFTVSDGLHQYSARDGGVIAASGSSSSLYCVTSEEGSWAVPTGTVTQLVSSVPSGVILSCTNPLPGTPGVGEQTEESYRAATLRAGLAASQGMPRYVKTTINNVVGVQERLVSVRQANNGWEVIVGGGDSYEVAYAILSSLLDPTTLVGSVMAVTDITKNNPATITTDLDHGYSPGQVLTIEEVLGMTAINNIPVTVVSVPTAKTFVTNIDTSSMSDYISGGVIEPNLRNESVAISDYPDTYVLTFVRPPLQPTTINVEWDTSALNFVNQAAVASLGAPAVAAYVNSIPVGQPMILYELQTVFQVAVSPIIPSAQLTKMTFAVSVNGIGVLPVPGTGVINGDPESYFSMNPDGSDVIVLQG